MDKKRLYFAHPINVYNTPLEDSLLARIAVAFPHWEVENPNQPHHSAGYERYRAGPGGPMEYFLNEVVPFCHGAVVLRFRDGAWGAGVYAEARAIQEARRPIWDITERGVVVYADMKNARVLSVDETRARVRDERGKSRPF